MLVKLWNALQAIHVIMDAQSVQDSKYDQSEKNGNVGMQKQNHLNMINVLDVCITVVHI